jgi:outer membrane immunogenic protein
MKRLLWAGVLLASAVMSNGATAADLYVKSPTGPLPDFGWTEFYFGLNIGYANGKTSWCTEAEGTLCPGPDNYSQVSDGIVEGGQFGYRWQVPNTVFVLGVEGMFDGLDMSSMAPGALSPATQTRYTQFNNLASVTGSLGFAMGRLLAYGKGGWVGTELHLDADDTVSGADVDKYQWVSGWTAGAGLEYMLYTHFSVGVEYNYYQFEPGNIANLTNSLGAAIPCAFCGFGRTDVQTITGRINIKLWPWGP